MRSNRHFQIAVVVVIGLFFVFSQAAYGEDPPPWQDRLGELELPECKEALESMLELPPAPVPKTGQVFCYDKGGGIIDCEGTGQDPDPLLPGGVEWPNPRFTVNLNDDGTPDGTVTDNLTGLMWLMDANCMANNYQQFDNDMTPEDGRVFWQTALDFVAAINTDTYYADCGAGYPDWRLPNIRELHSLVDFGKDNPALPDGHPFLYVPSVGYYWSSTTRAVSSDSAWYVLMSSGFVGGTCKGGWIGCQTFFSSYVWPVRGGN